MSRPLPVALFLVAVAAALSGCGPSYAIAFDWERTADFREFESFELVGLEDHPPAGLTRRGEPDPAQLRRLFGVIRAGLRDKGYREAEADADLAVSVSYGGRRAARTVSPRSQRDPFQNSYISEYREGVVTLDIRDRRRDRLVFHAWATADTTEQRISADDLVALMRELLAGFPEQGRGY